MGAHLPKDVRENDLPRACTKCGEEKPADDFHPRGPCKRRRECKSCWIDHHDNGTPASIAAKRRWFSNNPEKVAETTRLYRKNNPEKYKATGAVNNALRSGRLKRDSCEECGAEKVHGHHDDYAKPLEVRWLCAMHHSQHHYRKEIS